MITLVIGGSASGKSAYAEQVAMDSGEQRIYLATMMSFGESAKVRIAKHRAMRRDKGFQTVECPRLAGFSEISCEGAVVLLEDLPNLVANEVFSQEPMPPLDDCYEAIRSAVLELSNRAEHLVIVTGDLCSDGGCYPEETTCYLQLLGRLQCALAAEADRVYEVVAGLPHLWKEILA